VGDKDYRPILTRENLSRNSSLVEFEPEGVESVSVAGNGYRVVLARAQKGMVISIPAGDTTGEDPTRDTAFYNGIAEFIGECGAKHLDE
jgi:hypothetical protein